MYSTSLVFTFLLRIRFSRNKSIGTTLRSRYNEDVVRLFRKLQDFNKKLAKCKEDLNFLNICKGYNYVPKFMKFKLYRPSLHNCKFYKHWSFKLLSNEINYKNKLIRKYTEQLDNVRENFSKSVSLLDKVWLLSYLDRSNMKYVSSVQRRHHAKLNNLGFISNLSMDSDIVIRNFSSRVLSADERRILSLGLNFKLPPFKLDFHSYFLPFERICHIFRDLHCFKDFGQFTSDLKFFVNKYFYKFKGHKVFSPVFSFSDIHILKTLRSDKSIIVSPHDKGKAVVLVNRSDYITKMTDILSDSRKFERLSVDLYKSLLSIEDKLNNFLRKLKSKNILTEFYDNLYVSGSQPGVLYGLPKIHKPLLPFRPILSAINTPTYNMAKFLVPIIELCTRNKFSVHDSFHFSQIIKDFSLGSDQTYMASFDVESLFTNVPVVETCDIIVNQLFPSPNHSILGLDKSLFRKFLKLAVDDVLFLFDGDIYQQLDGMPMGSPLGPAFANSFLCFHESKWLNDCPESFKPILYMRYIDDCFLLFKEQSHSLLFLNYLNSKHNNINFSMETELSASLPFLDILVSRSSNGFSTSLYRKPSSTLSGMNFFSFAPFSFKLSAIRCRVHRAFHLCSDWFSFHNEMSYLRTFFRFNLFPDHLLNTCINRFLSKLYRSQPLILTVPQLNLYLTIPYLGPLSLSLSSELRCLFSKYFPHCKIPLLHTNSHTISSFFRFKDIIPLFCRSSVIYSFKCVDCQANYVGQTGLHLFTRICKHKGLSHRTNLPISSPEFSSVRNHSDSCRHPLRNNDFSILRSSSSSLDRKILESLYIHSLRPSLNNQSSSTPLFLL